MRLPVLLLLLALPGWGADPAPAGPATEPPPELPAAAGAVIDRLAKATARLEAEHRSAVIAERGKAIEALQKVLKDTTRSGDLDAANAVKARLDALREENDRDLALDLLGVRRPPDAQQLILGTWDFAKTNGTAGTLVFTADGAVAITIRGVITVQGRWEKVKGERIRFTHPTGWEEVAFQTPDRLLGESSDLGRDGISATRRSEKAKGR